MKQAALRLIHSSGLFAPFRFFNRNKVLVLMYHRFSANEDEFATSASDFEAQLKYLKQHYNVVSLGEAVRRLLQDGKTEAKTAVITIDDGYRDAYQVALPILKRNNLPATIFVVTQFLDRKMWLWTDKMRYINSMTESTFVEFQPNGSARRLELQDRTSRLRAAATINTFLKGVPDDEKDQTIMELASSLGIEIPEQPTAEYEALTWEELLKMEEQGIEIGSHTYSHPILTRVSLERVRMELRKSKERLEEKLDHEVPLFCYPNGINNRDIRDEVKRAGYSSAVTATPGFIEPNPDLFALSRISAEHDLPHFAQNTSGFEGFKNSLRSRGSTPELT
ncbi:MAG TPA: polysaccharide deacetylase family protein [Pyrinomonadaceae bacterium]|jgi:Predicted xylanase/chitin deacetylase|nr:polysaccharide deacetylase family protein [Pyrinomonadaceae bacterium]